MHKKIIILITFLLHALFFIFCIRDTNYIWMWPDSTEYNDLAHHILDGDGIVNNDGSAQFYRLPGYPVFLAACYKMFGDSVSSALWVQIIVTSIIPLLIYFLALALFSTRKRLALCAAGVSMMHTGFALYSCMLTTETVFMIPWLLFLILFFREQCLGAGLALGVASMIRPVGHYVLVIALVMLLVRRNKKIGGLVLGWLAIVTPWLVRNYLLTGALFFHTLPGLHFVKFTATEIIMEHDHIERDAAYPIALAGWHQGPASNEHELCVQGEKYAWSLIKENPWLFMKVSIKQMFKTCCGLYAAQPLFIGSSTVTWHTRATTVWDKLMRFLFPQVRDAWLVWFVYVDLCLYVILAFGSISFIACALVTRSLWGVLVSTIPFMTLFVLLTLAYGCARLRMPLEPFMIIMTCWWVRERE